MYIRACVYLFYFYEVIPTAVIGGSLTSVAVVVNEDDLLQQHGGRGLQHAVDGPQQGGPGLVVKGDDDGGGG